MTHPRFRPRDPTSRPEPSGDGATPTVRAAALVDVPGLVAELGGDPVAPLRSAGLSPAELADPDAMRPAATVGNVIELASAATGCGHFGALLGARRDLRTYLGTLGRVVWAAPDLRTAIDRFADHIESHAGGSRWTLDVDGELARLRNETLTPGLSLQGAGHNLVLAARLLRAVTADRFHLSLVFVAAAEPADVRPYRTLLGAPVLFDQEVDALVFHSTELDLPVPTADAQLSSILLRHRDLTAPAPPTDLIGDVAALIEKNLLAGVKSVDAVARFLPYSRSTLQQRLAELGTSHQAILDDVRDRWAKDRLADSNVSMVELARTLCYGSADTFAAAFKRRNGVAPTVWRRGHARATRG